MRILFATGSVHLPDQVGGAERSMHTLLELLRENGHLCEAVAGLPRGPRRKAVSRMRLFCLGLRVRLSDRRNGYPTHRTLPWLVPKLARQRIQTFRPDLVITQLNRSHEIAKIALRRGIRVALMVRNAEFEQNIWPHPHPHLRIVSNSNFIAAQLRQRMRVKSETVYEIIRLSDYKVERRAPELITFINPVPLKGLDTALAIAGLLPHRRFLFVEGWRLEPSHLSEIKTRVKPFENITFMPWTPDIKSIYARTAVLLVPSRWEEAFGRVALEAQVSGIPVVASNIGGLTEVLEGSGILVAPDAAPQVWAAELERLLNDSAYYEQRSAAARANATRPEFDPRYQLERFLSLVSRG